MAPGSKKMTVHGLNSDRISSLPQDITGHILTCMPIRDAIRTSILSRNWRSGWKNMTKLHFDDKMVKVSSYCNGFEKYKLASAILNVLLLHTGSIHDISIDVREVNVHSEFDQIIRYLSTHNLLQDLLLPADNTLASPKRADYLPWEVSFFPLQGLDNRRPIHCLFRPPAIFDGFSKLCAVRFAYVYLTSITLQRFLSNCPLLRYLIDDTSRESFTFFELSQFMHLTKFLEIRFVYMEYFSAGGMPYKLSTSLVQLKTLKLDVAHDEEDEVSSALCLIRSSPNLKELSLLMCNKSDDNAEISKNFPDIQDYSGFTLDHLKFFMLAGFCNEDLDVDFLKLITAKSPMLKKAEILLDEAVSPEDEVEILRGLLQLPFRASPSAKLIVKRPEPGFWLKYIESSLSSFFGPEF